ncbi:MAG: amino acid adenylation domain-containing protein [Proteobacteria bacterium]|nr:amino acid adenylation domain-containing protein [Pseudomonadota bacterium]
MNTSTPTYKKTVVQLFEAQVRNTPHLVALRDKNIEYTYATLNEKANQFAHWLVKNSVNQGDFVAILLEPSADFVVCMLAIIKVGAIYLPLDIMAPQARLKEITDDSNPKLIITSEKYKTQLKTLRATISFIKHIKNESIHYSKDNLHIAVVPKSPIYLMYTSGSTGKPKGIVIPHDAVVNLGKADNFAKISEGKIIAQFSNPAFDACTFEVWSALLNGAVLSIIPLLVRTNYNKLKVYLQDYKIQCLFLPTGYFHQLVKSFPETLNSVETIIFGGEQANHILVKKFINYRKTNALPIILMNGYGPTEATVFTSLNVMTEDSIMDDEELISIGKPIKNVKTYILDEHKNPVLEGELYISGINLALGYHNSKSQNQEKFLPNPFEQDEPYNRIYKTGDKVKLLPSGNLLCLGRLDDQVKVGGYRIHLNEVENELMKHEAISLVAVVAEVGGGSHKMLTAYIVFSSKESLTTADDIRQFLSLRLPPYMLPSKYVAVDDLPLTLIGKVDKKNLDKLPHTDLSFHVDGSSSSTIEESIKNIWKHLLNRSNIETNKNLFELGANSLLITEACQRINEDLNVELQISDILTYPTIRQLSRFLEGDFNLPVVRKQSTKNVSDIAIIGMSCRFPKANSIEDFWENLCQGKNCLDHFSEDELAQTKNKIQQENSVPVRGILSDIEQFDANFFGFNPIDASVTDPQHRLFLECAWEALEQAGIVPSQMGAKKISVFAGMTDSTYLHENLLKNNWASQELDRFQQRIASSLGMLSTQVSYHLNLKGRSLNINTACSTGLVTVAQACQELMMGTSDVALAGAVSIVVPQVGSYIPQQGGIESPDGECRPFERRANGTVFSNGLGVIILKRLEDALADNDTIYAVIKGVGVNNDGSDKLGYTAPSVQGQMSCIREALSQSKVNANEIGYVEAHGTATALGDVIEMEALSKVYREQTDNKKYCALGSVKANIGHTDAAAGISGLIKTILCLFHKKIPPLLHFQEPNPNINFEESPFFINTQLIDWKKKTDNRYAGVSSFGVGGTNVHMILSEYAQEQSITENSEYLMVLSARNELALQQNKEKFIRFLERSNHNFPFNLADIAYTLQTGREAFPWRCFSSGHTKEEIIKNFSISKMNLSDNSTNLNVIFMFPGQGMQYYQMASQLMNEIPFFSTFMQRGVQLATPHLGVNLLDIINNPSDERLNQTQYAQPALFIIEYALANLLMHYGLKPDAMIGHSIGEYVAACLAGVFSFEDAILLICQRGLLMAQVSAGEMLAIECTKEELSPYLNQTELALHNATRHCVVSGKSSEINQLEQSLSKAGKLFRKLKVSHAFHSRSMEEIQKPFKDLFSNITISSPQISIVSNLTGKWLSKDEVMDADYWYKHLRQTVQFCKGIETLLEDQNLFFVEVGPGQSLNVFLKEVARHHKKKIVSINTLPAGHSEKSEVGQLINVLGMGWQHGIKITWPALYGNVLPRHVPLPTYAFQKQRYWIEPDKDTSRQDFTPRIYKPVWSHQQAYIKQTSLLPDLLAKHSWIIFKDETGLGDALISLLENNGINPIIVMFDKAYVEKDKFHFNINPTDKSHYLNFIYAIKNNVKNPVILHLASYSNSFNKSPSVAAIDEQLGLGFYSLLYLSQAYIEVVGDKIPLKVGVITTGTQQVLGTEDMSPINAVLNGSCRVIMQEHNTLKFKLIDLDSAERPQDNINLLSKIVESCLHEDWDESSLITPYRNGHQWCLMYGIAKPISAKIKRLKDNGVYLLTGGIGGIALSCCEAIVQTVSTPTFILLSRRKIPLEVDWEKILQDPHHEYYEKIKKVDRLRALGAKFIFYQVDITEFKLLDEVIRQSVNNFGKINGLIHAAGISNAELIQSKTKAKIQDVFLPKIYGTYNLIRTLKSLSLDFVVLKSSLAALLGGFRHIDYCGANACLDSFVTSDLFSFSSFVVSINWNTWRDVGIAAEAALRGEATFLGKGNDISPQQGQALFLEALEGSESNVAISNIDLNVGIGMHGQITSTSAGPAIKIARQDLNVLTNYLAPANETESKLAQLWQDMLGIEEIGISDDFFALGGHSLKAISLVEKINKTFNCSLPATQIYRSPTIKQLCLTILHGSENQKTNNPISLKIAGEKPPYLFLCHPISGLIQCFNSFVSQSDLSISIYGLQDPSIEADKMLYGSLPAMAEDYLSAIKKIQPSGPYFLMGYSFGGNVLYEVANMLLQQGQTISLLAMIDSWAINSDAHQCEENFKKYIQILHPELSTQIINLAWKREELLLKHSPSEMDQEILLFKASQLSDDYKSIEHPTNGWSSYNKNKILCHKIDGNHETIINAANSKIILEALSNYLHVKSFPVTTELA